MSLDEPPKTLWGAASPPLLVCDGSHFKNEHIIAKTRQLAGLRGAPTRTRSATTKKTREGELQAALPLS